MLICYDSPHKMVGYFRFFVKHLYNAISTVDSAVHNCRLAMSNWEFNECNICSNYARKLWRAQEQVMMNNIYKVGWDNIEHEVQ